MIETHYAILKSLAGSNQGNQLTAWLHIPVKYEKDCLEC